MDWQIVFTLGLVALALTAMVRELAAPDLVLMATLICLGAAGILTPIETFAGFANPVVAAIGALFILSAALRETGALEMTLGRVLGRFQGTRRSLIRMTIPVAALSGFLNNAPIVAMMTPTVIDWARQNRTAASKFLIPLSYASILGSVTTTLGAALTVTGVALAANPQPDASPRAAATPVTLGVIGGATVAFYVVTMILAVTLGVRRLSDNTAEHR